MSFDDGSLELDPDQRVIADTVAQVLAYQAGDDAVLEGLFGRYYPRVLGIVRMRMGPLLRRREESSDLAQATLAAAFEDLKAVRLAGEGALIHWLAVVAENVIRGRVDYHTARKRHPELEVELRRLSTDVSSGQFGLEPSAPVPLPADHAVQRETLRTLTSCLAELSPEYREVLILRRIAGCSAEYTAERMGRSVGAVNMLVARAEARLLGLMASRGHSPEDP